jgi:hypothetical protein
MAMDKSVNPAPVGLGSLPEAEPISVEIVDPEAIHISGEGFDASIEQVEPEFDSNLAENMSEGELQMLAGDLLGDYDADLSSRKEWLDIYVKGLKLLGLQYESRTEPWPGASGVFHPLLMESAVKFQSEMIMETFPAAGPVRTVIIGKETPEKKKSATRVEADMNYELTERMQEYRPEHERLLIAVALSGNAFKKIYYDPSLERQVAVFIPAEDVVVPYGAANIETAERITHRMRKTKNELRKLQVAGFYRDVDLGDPVHVMDEVEKEKAREQGFQTSIDNRFQLLEMHVNLDLEGYEDVDKEGNPTGIALPYVVTVEKGTGTILAIRRNWLEDDPLKNRRQHFVHYGYIPGFGFYYFGLIHLIGGHTHTATSLLRQLIDAGTLANLPGGLKSRGLRVKGDDTPIAPGEFRDVDVPSGSIRDNILPLPYKEPSQTLMVLMDKVVADGRQFAATADLNVSDMSAQAPVGTTLAILERVLKVMSAIQARIHYTMKQEFKLLAIIIRDNTPADYDYDPEVGDRGAKRADYDCVDVLPVSDPNASTMAQRVIQYQAVIQLAQSAPQIYDLQFLHRQMIETLGVKNATKIIPMKDEMRPVDPVTENMNVMTGKPVKAFMYQDHEAHIGVHMAMMQDPKLAQTIGQNPQAQTIMGALQAHLMEHIAFQYRKDIEKQLGATLPPPPDTEDPDDENYIPENVEVQVSQLAAQAAAQLLQKDMQEAQAQQIAQQQQDPVLQMQQMELQLKQQEVQIKQQQVQMDAQNKQAELQMKQQQFEMEVQIQQAEIARQRQKDALDAAVKAQEIEHRKTELSAKQRVEGAKLGAQVAKHRADKQHEQAGRALDIVKHAATLEHQREQAKPSAETPTGDEGVIE